ncbi:MAG: hypothetical protein WAU68_08500 [Vitreimonas sp.]
MRFAVLGLAFAALAALAHAQTPAGIPQDASTFDREFSARFQYPPPEPLPAEIAEQGTGQIADATYFAQFPNFDRAYTPAARQQARRLADRLRSDAGRLSHEQFVLRVAEIAALADNGHTAIGENAFRKNTSRLPVRTFLFADGLYLLRATPANADLLGARIDAIDGHRVEDVFRQIRRYHGGEDAYRRISLLPMLESPALLQAAGIAREHDALTLRGVTAQGAPFERRIIAEQRDRGAPVSSTGRTVYPTGPDNPMRSFLSESDTLPIYLHGRQDLFWIEPTPADGLYVGVGNNNDSDDLPIATFLDSALNRIRTEHPRFVVLDMRMNGGGDFTKTYAFARALPAAASGAPIYVLTSAWTFSAAITTVGALKQEGGNQVHIVGAPVGDRLRFWAEGGQFALPNSFLTVGYAAGRYVYDDACRDTSICSWLGYRYPVRVSTLAPEISAPLTFAAYREGRDPAMEAVLAREARSGSRARTR